MVTQVETRATIDEPWLRMEPLRLGEVPSTLSTPDEYILVSEDGCPSLRVDHYQPPDEQSPFTEKRMWHEWLVLGAGHRVHLVHKDSRVVRECDLGTYFGSLWADPRFLLVASADRVFKLAPSGEVLWSSAPVGIDGVVLHRVAEDLVYGEGEWDPPGGWRPFRIALESGEAR